MGKKVALVLGGGGARGLAHIGVIRELIRHGFEIASVAGTSMGAVVGGMYAAGKLDEYETWMRSLSKFDVFSLMDFTFSTEGIIKAERVLNEIKKFIPDRLIEELPVSFAAVASDILKGEEVVLTKGSLFEAIRASIAIPMLITPVKKNDTIIVDGGILNPVPVNRVFRHDDDILVAVDVSAFIPYDNPPEVIAEPGFIEQFHNWKLADFLHKSEKNPAVPKKISTGYFNLMVDSSLLMLAQIRRLTFEKNPPDLLVEISKDACSIFDFYKASEMIELGEKTAVECLEKWGQIN
jgi:NTE family protein